MARCNGAKAELWRHSDFSEDSFRSTVHGACTSDQQHLIVSYSRKEFLQTGQLPQQIKHFTTRLRQLANTCYFSMANTLLTFCSDLQHCALKGLLCCVSALLCASYHAVSCSIGVSSRLESLQPLAGSLCQPCSSTCACSAALLMQGTSP